MSTPPTPPPVVHRSRTRRFVRWLVLSLLGGIVLVTIWSLGQREVVRAEGNRELTAAIADVDRDDPDWTWERLNAARKRPPEGKNGAELIPQIKKLSHADWGRELAKPEWKTYLEVPPNERFSARVLAVVRRDADASAEAVKLARTLKDRPFGHREIALTPDVLNTPLNDTQHTRHVADVLRWDIALAVEDGDTLRAPDTLLAILNAARSIGDEPFLISQLVHVAVRSVAVKSAERLLAQTTDPLDLTDFQRALAADADEPILLYGIRGDRAMFDRLIENLANGTVTPGKAIDSGFDTAWGKFSWWHYRVRLLADRALVLSWMTVAARAARLPLHEQPAAFAALPAPPNDPDQILARLLLPAVDKVAEAHWRSVAEARCAVVGIACERFRQQHKRWPESLAELTPAFISAVPIDPYNAEPLRYAKLNAGVVVYSVGKDLRGDGGTLDAPDPQPNPYARFRLWNPDQRRLPAPPDPPEPPAQP
jgi:hypothetical protein